MKPQPTDQERVEQIRASMQITTSGGKKLIVRTHKNFIACELLEYVDKLTAKQNEIEALFDRKTLKQKAINRIRDELMKRIERPKNWSCAGAAYTALSEDNAIIMKALAILLIKTKNLP